MATFTARVHRGALKVAAESLPTQTLKAILCTSDYTPNPDTHVYASSITNEIATGGGYTQGGAAVTASVSYNASTDKLTVDATDIEIEDSTLTWRTLVLVDTTPGTDATNPIIMSFQGDADTTSDGGTTTITMPTGGIFDVELNPS